MEQSAIEITPDAAREAYSGNLPRHVVVGAWITAFIPVVAVFLIWLVIHTNTGSRNSGYPESEPGNSAGAYPFETYSPEPAYADSPTVDVTATAAGDPASQASQIDQALQQTAKDRQTAVGAVQDIMNCGSANGIQNDVTTLQGTQKDRTDLAIQLQNDSFDQLTGGSQAAQLLEAALQDSATSDGDYAQAGADFTSSNCTPDAVTKDSNFVAAQSQDKTATTDKTSFTQAWNSIAQQYALQQWDQSQF